MVSVKPMDEEALISSVKKTGCIVSVEEHQITGGVGSAIAEVISRNFPVPQEFVGMPDSFGQSGQPAELIEHYGMGKDAIIKAVRRVLRRKK